MSDGILSCKVALAHARVPDGTIPESFGFIWERQHCLSQSTDKGEPKYGGTLDKPLSYSNEPIILLLLPF